METKSTYRTKATSNHQTSDWLAPMEPDDALADEKQRARAESLPAHRSEMMRPVATGSSYVNVGGSERIGSLLAGGASLAFGLMRPTWARWPLILAGSALLYRGGTGHCFVNSLLGRTTASRDEHAQSVEISETVIVDRPRAEVFAFWRNFENLPRFMDHLRSVRQLDGEHSHWIAQMPAHMGTLSWNAVLVEERRDEYLAWQSVADALVDNAGAVGFNEVNGGRGTEVQVNIRYRPPAGAAGLAIGRALNPVFSRMVHADIQRLEKALASPRETAAV